jgi:hypothetical protein
MILLFPSLGSFSREKGEQEKVGSSIFIRSFNKNRFNAQVRRKVGAGWVVHQMTSSFRQTPFGGIVTYFCELRRAKEG